MKNGTLQRQLRLWTVLLVVIPSLLIMTLYTVFQIKVVTKKNLEMINQRVEFQKLLIENWLEERAEDVRKISRLHEFQELDEKNIKSTLALMQEGNKHFDSLSFINKDGSFRVSTLSTGIRVTSVRGQPYYQAAAAGKEYISDIVIGRNSGLPIINLSSPVYDSDGNFQGLVLGSVRTTTIEKLLRDNWIGRTGEILLVNREGILIAEPRYVNILIDRGIVDPQARMKVKLSPDALAHIRLGEDGIANWTDYLGNKVMGAYQFMPEHNWTLIGSIGEGEILAPIYMQLAAMAGSTVVLVLFILPWAARITNRIKRPIDWLIEQSNYIAAENYEILDEKRLTNTFYEINLLQETFITMGEKIKKTIDLLKEKELQLNQQVMQIQDINATLAAEVMDRQEAQIALYQLNCDLENKVDERTVQLQEINATLEEEIMERQSAQEELQKYRLFFIHSRDIMLFVDFKSGNIIEANPAAEAAYGFTREELLGKRLIDLRIDQQPQYLREQMDLAFRKGITFEIMHRRKDGSKFPVEVNSIGEHIGNKEIVFSVVRDITERRKLQSQIQNQVEVAGVVQRSLLTADYFSDKLTIRTIFRPLTIVSGDFYGYRWTHDQNMLHGYLIDVSGHGVATALYTSAVSTLLNEMMDKEQPWSLARLSDLNRYLCDNLQDNIFVALIAFSLDFRRKQLTYWSAGINHALVSTQTENGQIAIPGIFLGVTAIPRFGTVSFPIQNGDTFFLLSDGILEQLPPEAVTKVGQFDEAYELLNHLTAENMRDDCSALCIEVKGMKPFPLFFDYSNRVESRTLRGRINHILQAAAGDKAGKIDIAVGEAISNARQYGENVRIKINKIGSRLIIRVRNDGQGFPGNARIDELKAAGIEQIFQSLLTSERGRGLPLMLAWSDTIFYNRQGTEVILIHFIQ